MRYLRSSINSAQRRVWLVMKFPHFMEPLSFSTSPPSVPILCQMNPIHGHTFIFCYFNIMFPLKPTSPTWSLLSGFLTKTLHACFSSHMHATHPVHLLILYFIILRISEQQYKSWSSSVHNFIQPRITSSLTCPTIITLSAHTSAYVLPLSRATMFNTHTKQPV